MRVLGVDPGLTRLGLGVVDGVPGGRLTMVAVDVLRTPAGDDIGARLIALDSFFVYPSAIRQLVNEDRGRFDPVLLDATFAVADGPEGLHAAVEGLAAAADAAVAAGAGLLIIDDGDVSAERVPVPSLLAIGAIHHRLVATGRRSDTSIIVQTDEARDVHHIACLLAVGADAICPRLALETVAADADSTDVRRSRDMACSLPKWVGTTGDVSGAPECRERAGVAP